MTMTNEEAIDRLTHVKHIFEKGTDSYLAVNMGIKALEKMPEWILVSEKLPTIGKRVLVCCSLGAMEVAFYYSDTDLNVRWYDVDEDILLYEPIAWMPLPEPYKTENTVLDNIRDDIAQLHDLAFSREEVLRIIESYRTESEDKGWQVIKKIMEK